MVGCSNMFLVEYSWDFKCYSRLAKYFSTRILFCTIKYFMIGIFDRFPKPNKSIKKIVFQKASQMLNVVCKNNCIK